MTTRRTRFLVSFAAALTVTLTLEGCASAPAQLAWDGPAPIEASPPTIRFDNEARDYVRVYLVGEQRQWLLGRVEPGALAMLRLPDAALADGAGPMRLTVLAGGHMTQRAADDPRATIALPQPASAMLLQRWTYSQTLATGQLMALRLGRTEAGRQ